MRRHQLSPDLISKNSSELALETRRRFKSQTLRARDALSILSTNFIKVEAEPRSPLRNARLLLTSRHYNHLFAQQLLAERGLLVDAINASRAGVETITWYWLLCLEPGAAIDYFQESKRPAPVEIRKRLEILGADVNAIREDYSLKSDVAHVGGKSEGLVVQWGSDDSGNVHLGGTPNDTLQPLLIENLAVSVAQFLRYDSNWEVTPRDGGYRVERRH